MIGQCQETESSKLLAESSMSEPISPYRALTYDDRAHSLQPVNLKFSDSVASQGVNFDTGSSHHVGESDLIRTSSLPMPHI